MFHEKSNPFLKRDPSTSVRQRGEKSRKILLILKPPCRRHHRGGRHKIREHQNRCTASASSLLNYLHNLQKVLLLGGNETFHQQDTFAKIEAKKLFFFGSSAIKNIIISGAAAYFARKNGRERVEDFVLSKKRERKFPRGKLGRRRRRHKNQN